VTYLLPVVAIVLGVLVLGETVTITVLAGIALVLAGVALTRGREKPAARDQLTERTSRGRGRRGAMTWARPERRRGSRTSAGRGPGTRPGTGKERDGSG